ncbi:MAG: family 1 glycosylhydrolase [Richelia sp. RM1_1_1]|nr:family 1 glycosylhydrolase [Richelia sp. RM1_1_1]
MAYQFLDDFCWNVTTASYQIEDAVDKDGCKPSVWNTFSETPGNILRTGENYLQSLLPQRVAATIAENKLLKQSHQKLALL